MGAKGADRRRIGLLRNRQHAKTVVVQIGDRCKDALAHFAIQHANRTIDLGMRAHREHFLDSALGDHLNLAAAIAHHGGKATARKIKRHLVDLYVCLRKIGETRVVLLLFLGALDNRQVHEVLVARLEIAVEIGVAQNARILLTVDIPVILQHHLVLRQRAGLVRAQHVHGAKVLNRVEVLNDGLFFAHGNCALGKARGDNHGQHLGRKTHGNADGKEAGIEPVALGNAVNQKDEWDHHHHKADEHPRDAIDAFGKAGLHGVIRNARRHRTKQSLLAHAKDGCGRAARDHAAAHKGDILERRCRIGFYTGRGHFLDRLALTRQAGPWPR